MNVECVTTLRVGSRRNHWTTSAHVGSRTILLREVPATKTVSREQAHENALLNPRVMRMVATIKREEGTAAILAGLGLSA